MNGLSILACLLVASSLVAASSDWQQFKAQYGKKYESRMEDRLHHAAYIRNKRRIEQFNEEQSAQAGYELGVNHLTDWTEKEYNDMLGSKIPNEQYLNHKNSPEAELFLARIRANMSAPLPDTVDWREKGAVTSVKSQGSCGAGWAFAAVGALEGQLQKPIDLSAQNLVDCVSDKGCSGGLPSAAFLKIQAEGGIASEAAYPYTGKEGSPCKFNKSDAIITDSGYMTILEGDEPLLQAVVSMVGPISVYIDASDASLQSYRSGVYKSTTCKNEGGLLNHGVLIIGYGTENGQDYWLVKNSWGTDWGDKGYFKIARNSENMCGIATKVAIPTFGGV